MSQRRGNKAHMRLSGKHNLVTVLKMTLKADPNVCLITIFFLVLDSMQEHFIISDSSHVRKLKTIYLYFHK